MAQPKLVTRTVVELLAQELGMRQDDVRRVLDGFDRLAEKALLSGSEVEVGSFGYLALRDPVNVKPLRGEVTRGRRVAFREKDANRHRWK